MIAEEEKDYPIGVNEKNRELYANEFGPEGEGSTLPDDWKPSIDLSFYGPFEVLHEVGTPLGYKPHKECDKAGVRAILATDSIIVIDRSIPIKVGEEPFKLYDHVKFKGGREFVICQVNREYKEFGVVDSEGRRFYAEYDVHK